MTDQPAAAPTEQPQPLNNYRITCITGFQIAVASPLRIEDFVNTSRGQGGVGSDKMWVNIENVVTIEHIGLFVPTPNGVTQMGPRRVT